MRAASNPRLTAAGVLACAALAAAPGAAAAAPVAVVGAGSGLTAPTGIAEAPDGSLWVADDVNGVCRLRPEDSPAHVADAYCRPDHAGPVAAAGIAFDAASQSFFVGDSSSHGGAVWRMQWDPASGAIASAAPIVRVPQDRVTAVAVMPSGVATAPVDILYTTKESTAVMRVRAPGGGMGTGIPSAVGHSIDAGSSAIAQLDGRIYLAEGSDITRLDLAAGGPAERIAGLAGGVPGGLAADPARGRIYAGTSNGLSDQVNVLELSTGALSAYERGFAGVTALAVDSAGDLLVADDPGTAAGVLDAENHGRLWRVPLRPVTRPSVRVDAAPAGVSASTQATFAYSSTATAGFECRLDAADWASCPGTGNGEIGYADLSDGAHSFEVRAVDPDPAVGTGGAARRVFVVDTRAPRAWIDPPASDEVVLGRHVTLDLLADEAGVDFSCALDGRPLEYCDSPAVLDDLELGGHELRIVATDAAGNVSAGDAVGARWSFTVVPPRQAPAPVAVPVPLEPPAREEDPAPPAAPVAMPPVPVESPRNVDGVTGRATSAARLAAPARLRLDVSRLARGRRGQAPRAVTIRFEAASAARSARVTLQSGVRRIAMRRVAVRPGANRIVLKLTRTESRRLRPGPHRLSVALLDDTGRRGPASARSLRVT